VAREAGKSGSIFSRPLRAKLIFNAGSGRPEESPAQLATILSAMQDEGILPEVYVVRPDSQLGTVVAQAIKHRTKLIVVAGGDGTIHGVVGAMIGSHAALGIIPIGTRNNLAFNLGITGDIATSVALLRRGRRLKIDVGCVRGGRAGHWFVEATALGLLSDLYPMGDDLQHGDLSQIGGLISTLISATPSRIRMILDEHKHHDTIAHMLLITNMPFLGPHFQISRKVSFKDGRLDVFTFSDMGKLSMLSYAALSIGGSLEEAGIKHYRARRIQISSKPRMPVIADGIAVGQSLSSLSVEVQPHALTVIAGKALAGDSSSEASGDSRSAIRG
jgi:diacylglycerol kinase family enzyme